MNFIRNIVSNCGHSFICKRWVFPAQKTATSLEETQRLMRSPGAAYVVTGRSF